MADYRGAPKAAVFIPVLGGFALLVVSFWRTRNLRYRSIILGCALLFSGPLAALMMLTTNDAVDSQLQPRFGIRREGNQLFAQATGKKTWPVDGLVPPIAGELLPESESSFFERLGAARLPSPAIHRATRMD